MLKMRMMFEALSAGASPPSFSPLHITSYELPSSSRLPKFMIAAVAGFIILVTALYYFLKWWFLRKCSENTGESSASPTADASPDAPGAAIPIATVEDGANKRLASKIAMAIPAFEYSLLQKTRSENKELHKDLEGEACAICLMEFSRSSGALVKVLPKCDHVFHSSCIDLWLCTHASCPICRASLFVSLFSRSAPPRPCSSPSNQSPRGDDPEDHV